MTDQIPADKVREIVEKMHHHANDLYVGSHEKRNILIFAQQFAALLPPPPRPTLEDMTPDERHACTGMQADAETGERVIIIDGTERPDGRVEVLHGEIYVYYPLATDITPRPDLPRLTWPDTEKPAPAPALPEGWRLADHPRYGRVIVTNAEPDEDGDVAFVHRADYLHRQHSHDYCKPADLTYLDQEADTSDAVPPNTLAEGSAWDDEDALYRACRESGRTQITVIDRDGDVSVWDASAENWHGPHPIPKYAPYTITHTGKDADQ